MNQKILQKSRDLFMRYGVKSISMDDIATNIGISKKTIYQHFANKSDLITKVVSTHILEEKSEIESILNSSKDAIDEMVTIARHAIKMMGNVRPTVIFDLRKYYHETWQMLEKLFFSFMEQTIYDNLVEGVKEGFYRSEINPAIISKLYVSKSMTIVDENSFPPNEFDLEVLYREMITYHLRGIASEKGLLRLAEFKSESE